MVLNGFVFLAMTNILNSLTRFYLSRASRPLPRRFGRIPGAKMAKDVVHGAALKMNVEGLQPKAFPTVAEILDEDSDVSERN
jgi:hypothetical protein